MHTHSMHRTLTFPYYVSMYIPMHTHTYTCTPIIMHMLMYTHTLIHAHSYAHTPILQIWFLQLGRKTLAILSHSAASIDTILLKIFQEFEAGEIVVKIDMVVWRSEVSVVITLAPSPCSVVLLFFPV